MNTFSLNKLWQLRGELDAAVVNEDYEQIPKIKEKYLKLVENQWGYCRAFICYNHAFGTDAQRRLHNANNIRAIAENIENYERKYIDGVNVSEKLKCEFVTPFLASEIWIIRAMYDKFLLQAGAEQGPLEKQQNMILGRALHDRLLTLVRIEQTEPYHDQLRPILTDVLMIYCKNSYS